MILIMRLWPMLRTITRSAVETVSGGFEPKQYHINKERLFFFLVLVCGLQKVFNHNKCRRRWDIYNSVSPALHSSAVSLKDCLGLGWRLSAVKTVVFESAKENNWDSTAQLSLSYNFFLSSKKHPNCHSLMLTQGKATFLSRGCRRRKALFRNSQEKNSWYAFKTDRTQTLPCAIKKTQLSSPSPSVTFSVSHLQGLLALPDFSSSPSYTLSATSSLQNSFTFFCHWLNFLSPISFSLPPFQPPSFSHTNHLFSFCLQTFPFMLSSQWN